MRLNRNKLVGVENSLICFQNNVISAEISSKSIRNRKLTGRNFICKFLRQSWEPAGLFGSGSGLNSKKFSGRFRAHMQNFFTVGLLRIRIYFSSATASFSLQGRTSLFTIVPSITAGSQLKCCLQFHENQLCLIE